MISFQLDDELELLIETTRKFAADQLAPSFRDAEAARAPTAAVRNLHEETGLGGLELPEALGGAELGSLARCLVNEELAAADAGTALALDRLGPALYAMSEVGGPAAVAALHAACQSAPGQVVLHIEATDRDDAPLSLELPWVAADTVSALVVLGPSRVVWTTEDLRTEAVRGAGLRAAGASRLVVDRGTIAGTYTSEVGAGRARARARLYVASLLLGVLRASCQFARDYAVEREAFGRPIAHHQALAFLITDMNIALESARLLVHEAAWRLDAGLADDGAAAAAFAECIDAARFIGPNGVQILGGHGFMADYPVEKYMREARALGLMAGGLDQAVEDAGRWLLASERPLSVDRLFREAS